MPWVAWLVLGLGMGVGLYDTAFATLGRIYGLEARSAITGITLVAGFASTVGWPLTAWGASELGWRETCLAWAAAHIVLGLPLNLSLPKPRNAARPADENRKPMFVWTGRCSCSASRLPRRGWWSRHGRALPRLLEAAGATTVQAVAAGALIGPSQVGARILEASLLKRFHPMVSARFSVALHPIGAGHPGHFRRRRGICSVHRIARRRQRHSHHCARNGAIGRVRPRELRLSARPAWRPIPCRDGRSAFAVRYPD